MTMAHGGLSPMPILMGKPVLIIRGCRDWPCACPKTNQRQTNKKSKKLHSKNSCVIINA
jgi:hypothetical protein